MKQALTEVQIIYLAEPKHTDLLFNDPYSEVNDNK